MAHRWLSIVNSTLGSGGGDKKTDDPWQPIWNARDKLLALPSCRMVELTADDAIKAYNIIIDELIIPSPDCDREPSFRNLAGRLPGSFNYVVKKVKFYLDENYKKGG